MRRLGFPLRDVWALTRPYWTSEERGRAFLLLAVVIALNLSIVGMTVLLSYWQRAFFNALENRDATAFWSLIFLGGEADDAWMPGFSAIAAVYVLVNAYALYLTQALQIRWRRWLTDRHMTDWLTDRAYYRIVLTDPT